MSKKRKGRGCKLLLVTTNKVFTRPMMKLYVRMMHKGGTWRIWKSQLCTFLKGTAEGKSDLKHTNQEITF